MDPYFVPLTQSHVLHDAIIYHDRLRQLAATVTPVLAHMTPQKAQVQIVASVHARVAFLLENAAEGIDAEMLVHQG
jgi:hypothetical protein